mmetsp:Transcript_16688/g.24992  ORF Transcript_16688/g.24992 Transcript_16688/m.24992 type:complete len:255 (-) Transcript_16688:42-806(-)
MKSGFLNKNSSKSEQEGLLRDRRSRPLFGFEGRGTFSSGGWEHFGDASAGCQLSQPAPHEEMKSLSLDCPILPMSLGNPKNALSVWYGRRHKDFTFSVNECFVTWDFGGGSDHEKYWTSIFTSPASQEKFMSGILISKPNKTKITQEKAKEGIQEVTIVWYKKKKEAEHAAAARALDCLSYREGMNQRNMCYNLCQEHPYKKGEGDILLPISVPDEVEDKVMTQPVAISNKTKDISMDEEFRSEYRSLRLDNTQ